MAFQLDSTQYYVTAQGGQALGPYTFPQVIQLWRTGQITAEAQFWTEADQQWQPLVKLNLDAADAEEVNTRIWKVLTPENQITGPFSYRELAEQLGTGQLSPHCKFWFPGQSHWIDVGLLSRVADPDSEEQLGSLRNLSQLTPPPIDRQRTQATQAGANFGAAIGSLTGLVVLLVIVVIALKSCTA
jgi:hypothetical protein